MGINKFIGYKQPNGLPYEGKREGKERRRFHVESFRKSQEKKLEIEGILANDRI